MANALNISSEEELLQLRNEGKISEDEYGQLLETLQRTTKVNIGEGCKDNLKPARTSGLAIASLVFSLIGPIGSIPAVICGHIALRKIRKEATVKGYGLALAGLIIGYAVLGLSIVVMFPLFLYWGVKEESRRALSDVALVELQNAKIEIATSELKHYSLDSTEGVLTQSGVSIDRQISSDGNGSLRIEATEPTTVRLLETGDIDIEDAQLIYQARLRTENLQGKAYLEMWCLFPGGGEYFSDARYAALIGSTGTAWTTEKIRFFLKKGQNPDNVKLNLVIKGKGTVWIDDIRLLKGPKMIQPKIEPPIEVTELKHYSLDNTEGVLTQSGVTIDRQISSDGNGSLRIEATEPTTIRLFETGDIDIEDARLIYQARLRTEDVEGQVYLEMWCHFAGIGNAFSRGLARPLTGTTEWTTEEIPFFLQKGENPDNVKLNLVIKGKGTAWIDDIRLLKGPLKY
jgi:hypothetical protein